MSHFDVEFWLRFLPFLLTAAVMFGWAVIQILQTPRGEWDTLTVCIVLLGIGTALYIGSLAVNYSMFELRWPGWYYDVLRAFLGFAAAIGIGPTYVGVVRAWRARRQRRTDLEEAAS